MTFNAKKIAELDASLLSRQVTLAYGASRRDTAFHNVTGSMGELLQDLSRFQRGPKDGRGFLQGQLVSDGRRLAQRVAKNHILMIDYDTGVPVPSVVEALKANGLAAFIYTTHSHLKTSSSVPEKAIIAYAKKIGEQVGHAADIGDTVVLEYLRTEKKYEADVLASVGEIKRQMGEDGVEYIIAHGPMPRVRVIIFLAAPFDFANYKGMSQKDAIDVWRAKYIAVCKRLGLPWDSSCSDPARLMYTPRISPNAALCSVGDGSTGHVMDVVTGACLDLDSVDETPYRGARRAGVPAVPATETVPSNAFARAAAEKGLYGENHGWQTPGLMGFLKPHGHDLQVADLCADNGFEVRYQCDTGFDSVCPNEEHHSSPDSGSSRDFMIRNAVPGESGWAMHCQHQTCKDMSGEDRAFFLDLILVQLGLGVTDLTEYSASAKTKRAEDQARAEAERKIDGLAGDGAALRAEIEAVTPETDGSVLDVLVAALAARPDTMETNALIVQLRQNSKTPQVVMTRMMSLARKKHRLAGKEKEAEQRKDDDDNVWPDEQATSSFGPPRKRETANPIRLEWGADDVLDCAVQRIHHLNAADPRLFGTPEGSSQMIREVEGRVRAKSMSSADWAATAADYLSFLQFVKGVGDVIVPAPSYVVNYFTYGSKMQLPVLESVMHVPVFAPDGSLVVTKGYNAALRMYLDPDIEARPLPANITQDDIDWALDMLMNALLRDFPFSDAFDGNDQEPIKTDQKDEDGDPCVNWARGPSSRCHMLCMLLQQFVRYMIDGPTPAYHIDKAAPGTGANYLADAMAGILLGRRATPTAVSEHNEELRKAVTSVLLERVPLIFFDNINHKMTSPHLAQVITTGVWKDRILGQSSTTGEIPIRNVWLFAGNNLEFSHELYRRLVPIRLDAAVPNPALDRGPKDFKYELHKFVQERRVDLLYACHILCGAWVQAGCPRGSEVLTSFDNWSAVMGGIMEVIGVPGFLKNRFEYLEAQDTESGGWQALAQGIYDKFQGNIWSAADVYQAFCGGMTGEEYQGPIELGPGPSSRQVTALGKILGKHMMGKTFRVRTTDKTGSEGILVSLVRRKQTSPCTYQFIKRIDAPSSATPEGEA